MQPLAPVSVVELFPEEREGLLQLLAGLSDEQWRAPTACAGWSVKDVALHLLGVDVANLSRRRDGFHDPAFAAPDADLSQWVNLVAALNRWNEIWVQAARRISPRLLCELLGFTGAALNEYFQELDLTALGGSVGWAGSDPAPVWLDIAREYTERWMHQQHIRDAVGQPGLKERRLFAPVLATFVYALPHTLRDVVAPPGTRVRLAITGEAGDEWLAVRLDDRWVLGQDRGTAADATVTFDQETAWRLFTRGLSKAEALQRSHLSGDLVIAEAVFDMVSIIA